MFCLTMMVKNEAHVIERCLKSCMPVISSYSIVDTGSTDYTCEIITHALSDIPGAIYHKPWVSFGHNRTESVELAPKRPGYLLLMDADDVLIPSVGFLSKPPRLVDAAYDIEIEHGETFYRRPMILKAGCSWKFEGVIHESIVCAASTFLPGLRVRYGGDGARSRDPQKFRDDALAAKAVLAEDPTNTRMMYLLAQSLRDTGELDQARTGYLRRAGRGRW